MGADGSGVTRLVESYEPTDCGAGADLYAPEWSPDGRFVAFELIETDYCQEGIVHSVATTARGLYFEIADTGGTAAGTAWSPDGQEIAFRAETGGRLMAIRPDGTGRRDITAQSLRFPSWQPIPVNGYARPKSADVLYAYLGPAFAPCTSPNRSHGPPLDFGSCNPPAQRSGELTVGTPDANGQVASSTGFAVLRSFLDNPATPADVDDVRLRVKMGDVRQRSDLADYTGELQARLAIRITDKDNTPAPGGPGAATTVDSPFTYTVPCQPTAETGIGSKCELETTADAVLPGSITGRKRAIWQLDAFELMDGGPDGDAETPDNSLFAVQGIYVP